MGRRTRIWTAIAAVVFIAGSAFVWSQYGEYDTRNIPSTFRIRAETEDGYHVHAQVGYEHTRIIPVLCYNPFSGYGGDGYEIHDIKNEWDVIPLKKSWRGLCLYEFEIIGIHCDRNLKWYDTAMTSGLIGLSTKSERPLLGSKLTVLKNGGSERLTDCDFDCSDPRNSFQIGAETKDLTVICKDE